MQKVVKHFSFLFVKFTQFLNQLNEQISKCEIDQNILVQ